MPMRDYLSTIDFAAIPETFYDDIIAEYDADFAGANAQIAKLTEEVAKLSAELLESQAHNYRLLSAIPADEDKVDEDDDDDIDVTDFDDFFGEDEN